MSFKFKQLSLTILICFLLIPGPVFAGLFDDIPNWLDHLTESTEEATQPMGSLMLLFFILYLVGIISLFLSVDFMETAIQQQDIWLTNLKPMTEAGWQFTAGIANLFIVLALIVIAFGFILKIESLQAKKALPRLIIVALLLNFSLVFVGMLVDIFQIIYNTILEAAGGKLFSIVMGVFLEDTVSAIYNFVLFITTIFISWAIPLAHPFAQLGYVLIFMAFFLPNIIIWIFQTIAFFSLALMFLLFAFLFGARVFIIQILAILSPLAFLALVLPQTRSSWTEWFKWLMDWLFVGILFLFLLVIGFKGLGLLTPKFLGGDFTSPIPGYAWAQLSEYIFYYFAIFIYMAVLLYISQKYAPIFAQFLIGQAQSMAGIISAAGLKPIGKFMGRSVSRAIAEQEKREREEKEGKRTLTTAEKLGAWPTASLRWALKKYGGTTFTEEELKGSKREAEKISQIESVELAQEKIDAATKRGDTTTASLMAAKRINMGGKHRDAVIKYFEGELAGGKETPINLAETANRMGESEEAEAIARATIHKFETIDEKEIVLKKMGFAGYDDIPPEKQDLWGAHGWKRRIDALVGDTTGNEIFQYSSKINLDKELMDNVIAKNITPPEFILGASSRFRDMFNVPYKEALTKVYSGPEEFKEKNQSQYHALEASPLWALGLGFPDEWLKGTVADISPGGRRERRIMPGPSPIPPSTPTPTGVMEEGVTGGAEIPPIRPSGGGGGGGEEGSSAAAPERRPRGVGSEGGAGTEGPRKRPGQTTLSDFEPLPATPPPSPIPPSIPSSRVEPGGGGERGGGTVIKGVGPRLKKEGPEKPEEIPSSLPRGRVENPEEKPPEKRESLFDSPDITKVESHLESTFKDVEKYQKGGSTDVAKIYIREAIRYAQANADSLGINRKQINLSEDQINEFASSKSEDKDFRTYFSDLLKKAK